MHMKIYRQKPTRTHPYGKFPKYREYPAPFRKNHLYTGTVFSAHSVIIKYQVNVLCALSVTVDLTNRLLLLKQHKPGFSEV